MNSPVGDLLQPGFPRKLVLHVGAGPEERLPPDMQKACDEIRLDIDPGCNPDIVADMADLPEGIGPYDAIYGSNCLEHLPFSKIQPCLKGWLRALKPGGCILVFVPDLEGVLPTKDKVYEAPCGPISGRDMIYGYGVAIEAGNEFMRHLSGFTQASLTEEIREAGFIHPTVAKIPASGNQLFGVGIRG
jgi:SAM-dependent methyltransferase